VDRNLNILVLPAGAESSSEVFHALKDVMNIHLFGSSNRSDHGDFLFRHLIPGIPAVEAPDFLERFNTSLKAHAIDAVFPCHDTVALVLAELRHRIPARIVTSGAETARICRSKSRCLELVAGTPYAPRIFRNGPSDADWPVFVKPDRGEGGKGSALLKDRAAYDRFFADRSVEDHLIAEHLPGEEFTVDCFSDRHGKLRFIGPRTRERVNCGISVRTTAVDAAPFEELAQLLHERLSPRGLWFFQTKRDAQGRSKLLEVSTRVSSSMGLYRHLGVNLPLLALYDAMDMDVAVQRNTFGITMDRALTSRFRLDLRYDTVYFDLDETLIVQERVNTVALAFAYQCRAEGKRSVLITKHAHDLDATLERYAIAPRLFDSIVHLRPEEEKTDHIAPGAAIFIDNAFAERRKVSQRKGIPVFDVDAIACLIDHRA
jgi:hypothetical protein